MSDEQTTVQKSQLSIEQTTVQKSQLSIAYDFPKVLIRVTLLARGKKLCSYFNFNSF